MFFDNSMPNEGIIENESSIKVLGIKVNAIQIPEIAYKIEQWIIKDNYHNYIVVANVDTVVNCKNNVKILEAVNASSLTVPDGFPLLVLERLHGYPLKKRAYGPDLMQEFLRIAEEKEYSNFFYGATENTLSELAKNLKVLFPKIKIAGTYSPPFRPLTPEEDREITEIINKAAPDVLWVGIGCPKQELWMFDHKEKLDLPVMIGVGAAFDFFAKTKPQAPRWIRDYSFEWLFRLISEPKRLWRRYLVNNTLFVYYAGIELLRRKLSKSLSRRQLL